MQLTSEIVAKLLALLVCGAVCAQPGSGIDPNEYIVDDNVLIETSDGANLSAIVVRPITVSEPLPAALVLTIYTRSLDYRRGVALEAASRGYVGIVADARGKRLSRDPIDPYKHNVDDTYEVIDWIAKQPWSNGKVGMYGGSYDGYTAWASTKRGHPALKTIVAYVAAIPGLGLPMENNVFLNANYAWPFYVANNRFLDEETYSDDRWRDLPWDWWHSGQPYREIDQVEGTPNPMLQEWLDHPDYDEYWQAEVPYAEDFERIDIPVLTITGYYDDGQISALHYLKEHYRYKPEANHYLLIGPYDHLGAQKAIKPLELRGYEIDPVAQFDTNELTFAWLEHVMRGGDRPSLLVDRINYQVMGANIWAHAPSIDGVSNDTLTLYLTDISEGDHLLLSGTKPALLSEHTQTVDFADRESLGNSYYPSPIIRDGINVGSGFSFITQPLSENIRVNGFFSGVLNAMINKRDFDFQVVLYEVMPTGSVMQLSYAIGRASYADDMTSRSLLEPGEWESIAFQRSRMTSRQVSEGSRLLVVLDVIKDPFHQINYGTGKDVSDESIEDADIPLQVSWRSDSLVRVPVWRGVEPE